MPPNTPSNVTLLGKEKKSATAGATPGPADQSIAPEPALPPLKLRDLIDQVANTTGQRRPDIKAALDAVLVEIGHALDAGRSLNLPPLGKIRVAKIPVGKAASTTGGRPMVLRLRREAAAAAFENHVQLGLAEPEEAG